MKKFISIISAALLCLCLGVGLIACQKNDGSGTTDTGTDGTSANDPSSGHDPSQGGGEENNGHTYSPDWAWDSDSHWHVCTDEACEQISEKSEHLIPTSGFACYVCGYLPEESEGGDTDSQYTAKNVVWDIYDDNYFYLVASNLSDSGEIISKSYIAFYNENSAYIYGYWYELMKEEFTYQNGKMATSTLRRFYSDGTVENEHKKVYSYNPDGSLARVEFFAGTDLNTPTNSYDIYTYRPDGSIDTVTGYECGSKIFTCQYNADNTTAVYTFKDHTYTYTYDKNGNILSAVTDSEGEYSSYITYENGMPSSYRFKIVSERNGESKLTESEFTFNWNEQGLPSKIDMSYNGIYWDYDGSYVCESLFVFDENKNMTAMQVSVDTDKEDKFVNMSEIYLYDQDKKLETAYKKQKYPNSDASELKYVFDSGKLLAVYTNGSDTPYYEYLYDSQGRVIKYSYRVGKNESLVFTTLYTYSAEGYLKKEEQITIDGENENRTVTEYYPNGNRKTYTDSYINSIYEFPDVDLIYTFDRDSHGVGLNRYASKISSDYSVTTAEFDENMKMISSTIELSDGTNRAHTVYTYYDNGEIKTAHTTNYGYDSIEIVEYNEKGDIVKTSNYYMDRTLREESIYQTTSDGKDTYRRYTLRYITDEEKTYVCQRIEYNEDGELVSDTLYDHNGNIVSEK